MLKCCCMHCISFFFFFFWCALDFLKSWSGLRTWLWKVPLCSIFYLFIFMKNKICEFSDFIGIERVMVKNNDF